MQEVFDFVLSHYEAILSVITLIISVVVFILRKRSVNCVATDIFKLCLEAILKAEAGSLKGKDKLQACVVYVSAGLRSIYPKIDTAHYYNFIVETIEYILETPQKKEVK